MNIPKGYKLVPVDPTEEMLVVMHDRILIGVNSKKREANILNDKAWWAAVVDSAPAPPQPIYDEAKERALFMSEYPLPSGLQWSEEHKNFGWVKKSRFSVYLLTVRCGPAGKHAPSPAPKLGRWVMCKYPEIHEFDGAEFIRCADFDRVTAERDALRNEVGQVKGEYDRAVNKIDALQALLTAADEDLDRAGGAYLNKNAECLKLRERADQAQTIIKKWKEIFGESMARRTELYVMTDEFLAALKPAEEPRNQCDGCQAGIPLVNGAHRMGKPGGYPDTMSCTAKLYKPAEGGGDEE